MDRKLSELVTEAEAALGRLRDYLNASAANGAAAGVEIVELAEISKRLNRSAQTIRKGWRRGEYRFLFREGAKLVTTEAAYRRWLDARTKTVGA